MENKKPRRSFSSQLKARLVLEYVKGVKSQSDICRENTISPSLFAKWFRQFQENIYRIFDDLQRNSDEEKIAKLEQIIGQQTIEIDFLKRGLSRFSP